MLILIFLLMFTPALMAQSDLCTDGTSLYTPSVELKKGSKKVLILGMVHYAPRAYYLRTLHTMERWIAEQNSSTTILTELYTCKGPVLALKQDSVVTASQLIELSSQASGDRSQVETIFGSNAEEQNCVMDIDGVNFRPAYVVDRNRRACRDDHDGLGCHWNMSYPKGPKVQTRSGDLVMDWQMPASQLWGSLGYSRYDLDGDDAVNINNQMFENYMLTFRNEALVREVIKELEQKNRLILPWGFKHNDGLIQLLEVQGFAVTRRFAVKMFGPFDTYVKQEHQDTYRSWIKEALPLGGHCTTAN